MYYGLGTDGTGTRYASESIGQMWNYFTVAMLNVWCVSKIQLCRSVHIFI